MKFLLAASLIANLLLGTAVWEAAGAYRDYREGVERDFLLVLQLVTLNSRGISQMREVVANSKARAFVLCMRRYKSAARCTTNSRSGAN